MITSQDMFEAFLILFIIVGVLGFFIWRLFYYFARRDFVSSEIFYEEDFAIDDEYPVGPELIPAETFAPPPKPTSSHPGRDRFKKNKEVGTDIFADNAVMEAFLKEMNEEKENG